MADTQGGMTFELLQDCFRQNNFPAIESDIRGQRFLLLRSMSRTDLMAKLMEKNEIALPGKRDYLKTLFESNISENGIVSFIKETYQSEREIRKKDEPELIDQLQRLQSFDWGGSYQNGLEKNIVDNYVKKIKNYEELNQKIEMPILNAVRGYTLNSWYNHWTSIMIEDIFKDQQAVLPAIGLVTKIDFFISMIPFDLKVTYFPENLMKRELRDCGYGNELTQLKQQCRICNMLIPEDLGEYSLRIHLYNKLKENDNPKAKECIDKLNKKKREIINKYKQNPAQLKRWFYENQGDKRFDASNRFFLVLTDEDNIHESWKVKRKIDFLRKEIDSHFNAPKTAGQQSLKTPFKWKDERQYEPYSDILFLSYKR